MLPPPLASHLRVAPYNQIPNSAQASQQLAAAHHHIPLFVRPTPTPEHSRSIRTERGPPQDNMIQPTAASAITLLLLVVSPPHPPCTATFRSNFDGSRAEERTHLVIELELCKYVSFPRMHCLLMYISLRHCPARPPTETHTYTRIRGSSRQNLLRANLCDLYSIAQIERSNSLPSVSAWCLISGTDVAPPRPPPPTPKPGLSLFPTTGSEFTELLPHVAVGCRGGTPKFN
ncbi:hypothetical protein BGY98DRAFT_158207 [Russula aff. rugulosa BPL654]|nr:hypothetical protein BGY98DRAFT_158207 [Russula aff. rugulosa BPL654]